MPRSSVLAVTLSLVVALAAPVAAGSLDLSGVSGDETTAQTGTTLPAAQEDNSSENDSISPGAKLAGVVSVQAAEVSGEVEERAFGHRIAAANSNSSKAAVIASESTDLEARLSEIRSQQETLNEQYENGSISTGQYKARSAKLVAEARTIQRLLNTTATTAQTLPSADLEANGVSVQSITTLQRSANNATGPEVSAIATEVAGNDVGKTPPGLADETTGNNTTVGPDTGAGDVPGNGSGGVPGNGANGNDTPGNGSTGTPGDGLPGNETIGNVTPGNGTAGDGTLGNGNSGNGSNGLPGNSSNVSTPDDATNVSAPGGSSNDSDTSSNVPIAVLSALAVEIDDSVAALLARF